MRAISTVLLAVFSGIIFPDAGFAAEARPNVILIMADDLGHECVEGYGGESYSTPQLSRMAREGAWFVNAHSQPICTPSRVQIMTGKYNVRNYTRFAALDQSQDTFGNAFRNAGYATCIVGKWQLGGNAGTIQDFGFDEHSLWNFMGTAERYVSPDIVTNGDLKHYAGQYGPDIQQEYAKDFIRRHKDQPFFLYYPMTLPHYPFQPTPDSADWDPKRDPRFNDTEYFSDMVAYLDKLVGDLVEFVADEGLADNTLIIFTADNGTDHRIVTLQKGVSVKGAKGKMTGDATHVPFIAVWPPNIPPGLQVDGLIDFSDVYATLIDVAGISIDPTEAGEKDGISFLPLLKGEAVATRDYSYCWYMERTDMTDIKRFVQNADYKLHSDGRFINKAKDRFEKNPLADSGLSEGERALKDRFAEKMANCDALRPERIPYNNSQPISLPGRVQAEQYDLGDPDVTYHDTTGGNSFGGGWRSDDVDIVSEKGRYWITDMEAGEWLEYSIDIQRAGTYSIAVGYSGAVDGAVRFEVGGKPVSGSIALPATGGPEQHAEAWQEAVKLPGGRQVLRLVIERGGMQIDHFTVSTAPVSATPIANTPPRWNQNPFRQKEAFVGQPYKVYVNWRVSDPDEDVLVYAKVTGPEWLTMTHPKYGRIEGTPSAGDVGKNVFIVSVSDGINPPVQARMELDVKSAPSRQ